MSNSVPSRPRSYMERFTTGRGCFFICVVQLMAAGGAFAENARAPFPDAAVKSPYVVDGLALGARVDFETPPYRGYQCSPSELFPDFMRCQRTQRQQDGTNRRSFETTNSILHDRDGKAVYVNRHIAPRTFDRNEIQAELKQISSKLGDRPREMRLPPREGVQTAIIAVWGKIQLTELDADAISIVASGESPRKGLLIDYLGNLRRSAQQGLPIYSLNGGAGYIWSASVGRNNVGHIRLLTVDVSALSPAATASPAPASEPAPDEVSKIETAAAEKPNAAAEPPPVEPENAGLDAGGATTEVQEAAAPEADKIAPLLAPPEADLAAAEAKSRLMEKLVNWAVGGLIVLFMIVASFLLLWRKRSNATKAHVNSETQPARLAVRAQASQALTPPKNDLLEERSAVDVAAVSPDAAVADAILLQNRKEQEQGINDESGSQKQEAQLVAVNDKNLDGAQSPSANVIACADCNREISKNDNFCMHCGASVAAEKPAAKTRLCSSCRQEIGTSDKFCRHCGASSLAVSAPSSMNGNSASPDRAHSLGHHDRVDEVVPSTRTSVKKKRAPR
jgi:hypothetical protein